MTTVAIDANGVPDKSVAWYVQDADVPPLPTDVRDFVAQYCMMPADTVQQHVLDVREKAWRVFPFPCIGQMRFLDLSIATQPAYAAVVARLTSSDASARLVDVGCGLGADLRRLVADGVDGRRLYGLDQRADFIDVGYDLFRDRTALGGRGGAAAGVAGDAGAELAGTCDFVHVASFLHLFGWEDQVRACTTLAELLRADGPDGLIFGRFVGSPEPAEYPHPTNPSGVTYSHDEKTFAQLWAEVSKRTGTEWKAVAQFTDNNVRSRQGAKLWKGAKFQLMNFEVKRA